MSLAAKRSCRAGWHGGRSPDSGSRAEREVAYGANCGVNSAKTRCHFAAQVKSAASRLPEAWHSDVLHTILGQLARLERTDSASRRGGPVIGQAGRARRRGRLRKGVFAATSPSQSDVSPHRNVIQLGQQRARGQRLVEDFVQPRFFLFANLTSGREVLIAHPFNAKAQRRGMLVQPRLQKWLFPQIRPRSPQNAGRRQLSQATNRDAQQE